MISYADQERLRRIGFTWKEIKAFDAAVDPEGMPQPVVNIADSPVWQEAIKRRIQVVTGLALAYRADTGKDMTRAKLDSVLNNWYAAGRKRDPFDWLKFEYKNKDRVADMIPALRRARAKAQGRTRGIRRLAGTMLRLRRR